MTMTEATSTMKTTILFTDEVSFHDSATITVSANLDTWQTSVGGEGRMEEISIEIFTAVSISLSLTVEEAGSLIRALSTAVKAVHQSEVK